MDLLLFLYEVTLTTPVFLPSQTDFRIINNKLAEDCFADYKTDLNKKWRLTMKS